MTWEEEQDAITKAIARFPTTFHLSSADTNDLFRFSQQSSYISNNEVILYAEKLIDGQWLSYAKGSPAEFQSIIERIS